MVVAGSARTDSRTWTRQSAFLSWQLQQLSAAVFAPAFPSRPVLEVTLDVIFIRWANTRVTHCSIMEWNWKPITFVSEKRTKNGSIRSVHLNWRTSDQFPFYFRYQLMQDSDVQLRQASLDVTCSSLNQNKKNWEYWLAIRRCHFPG